MSDTSGQACALTVMTPIESGKEAELRVYLEALPRRPSPLAKLERTHFARWVIVPDFVNDPAQPEEDHLSSPYLVFTSNFDGPTDSYLDELCDRLAPEAREIWGRCAGCPASAAGRELKEYLLQNRIETGYFVAAYPDASVAMVKRSLEVRERMIDLAVRAQSMTAAELQQAFARELGG
ncbi:MAG: hypothetical protein ACJ76S_07455 [Solirubrobacteraceae bacterium]